MAIDINAYFKVRLNQTEIEQSISAQDWTLTVRMVNDNIANYIIEPNQGFFLTVVNRSKVLEINEVDYPVEQSFSFALNKEIDSSIAYNSIATLINWLTIRHQLICCLSWDGETVDVLFNRGNEYVVNRDRSVWIDIIKPLAEGQAIFRLDTFAELQHLL